MKRLAAEFAIIVAGILLTLAVDEWRQDREKLRIASEHRSDVASELRRNLCIVEDPAAFGYCSGRQRLHDVPNVLVAGRSLQPAAMQRKHRCSRHGNIATPIATPTPI
jgi:hypothetical protein